MKTKIMKTNQESSYEGEDLFYEKIDLFYKKIARKSADLVINSLADKYEDWIMDGDDVERMINYFTLELNWLSGNISYEEYQDKKTDKIIPARCPLCGEVLKHIRSKKTNTHIYSCNECSFVGMEYIDKKDADALNRYLGINNN